MQSRITAPIREITRRLSATASQRVFAFQVLLEGM